MKQIGEIKGTVTGVVPGKGYYVQYSLAAWCGIWVEDAFANLNIGNGVLVDGLIKEKDIITNSVFVGSSMFKYEFVEGRFYDITGIVNGEKNIFQIEPRNESDILDLTIVSTSYLFYNQLIKVYSNPFNNIITIENHEKVSRVRITNIIGQSVLDVLYPQQSINTEKLPDGVYVITFIGEEGILKSEMIISTFRL